MVVVVELLVDVDTIMAWYNHSWTNRVVSLGGVVVAVLLIVENVVVVSVVIIVVKITKTQSQRTGHNI